MPKMNILGVIPARWASTRFEGKVLAEIQGKPMIRHVWERAKKSRLLTDLIIACDDQRVYVKAKEFGAKVVLTSSHHPSGTDRVAEAVRPIGGDIIINIQADEPLIDPATIDTLAQAMVDDESFSLATVIKRIDNLGELDDPHLVKVVIDQNHNALYFSRSVIPFNRSTKDIANVRYYKHLGLYAYRRNFLFIFCGLPKSYLEEIEALEQLRALEAGYKIKTIETTIDTIGVDTLEDLRRLEEFLAQKHG